MSSPSNNTPPKGPVASKSTLEQAQLADASLHSMHGSQLHREQEEPSEGMAPVPVFLIFAFSALMFWGGIYIQRYSGGYQGTVCDHNWTPTSALAVSEKPFDPIVEGKKLFTRNCQQCHQSHGKGVPGVYPPLDGSEWAQGDPRRIGKLLLAGMSGTLTVHGEQFTGNMPSFNHWKDKQIAAVLTYVRQEWSNKAEPVPESLITELRESIKGRNKPWKPEELLAEHPF